MAPNGAGPSEKARNFAYYQRITVRDMCPAAGAHALLAGGAGVHNRQFAGEG